MTELAARDIRLLMQAALDGELDVNAEVEVETRIAQDPGLAAEWDRLIALRTAIRTNPMHEVAPERLRAKIAATARTGWRKWADFSAPNWRMLAASVVIASGLSSILTSTLVDRRGSSLEETLIFDHMRGLLAAQPVDILSTDRHTVKPWFDSRLALSPSIVDLSDKGYALVGGRVDVFDGVPVPTLVYRLRNHLISVTALPMAHAGAAQSSVRGFRVARWVEGDLGYWAVSDLTAADLATFAREFQSRAAARPAE